MNNTCYILRGLPGTGKSRLAKLIKEANAGDYHVEIFSTDDLFINAEGIYEFDAHLLKWHHEENLRQATRFFNGQPRPSVGCIAIIDNTNTQNWEYEPYAKAAKEAGWDVQIITLDWNEHDIPLYAKRNKHGVPEEAIRRMADRWEYPAGVMKFGSDEWRDTFA
jgi:tRNA uridine 5-carbamoylmethylation protein Kti12